MNPGIRLLRVGLLMSLSFIDPAAVQCQADTAFTYQGYLRQSDNPANGNYCFEFRLFDAEVAGTQIGSPALPCNVLVQDGRFNVNLDFGAEAFNTEPRWLEISVNPEGGSSATPLSPRQRITPAPLAMFAHKAAEAQTATAAANGVPAGFSIMGTSQTPPPGYQWSGATVDNNAPTEWLEETSLPDPLYCPVGGMINGKLYISQDTKLFEYDPALSTWTAKADVPSRLYDGAGAVFNGRLYVIAGQTGNGLSSQVYSYDPTTNIWSIPAPLPVPVFRHTAVATATRIHVFGGGMPHLSGAHFIYNPTNNTWATGATLPTPRADLSAVHLNGKIHVLGGDLNSGKTNVHEVYDPSTNTWSPATPLPAPLSGVIAVAHENRLHAFGGRNAGDMLTAEHRIYNPASGAWTSGLQMPTRRAFAKPSILGDTLYIVGGLESPSSGDERSDTATSLQLLPNYYIHIKQ